jgi:hypothetical protein
MNCAKPMFSRLSQQYIDFAMDLRFSQPGCSITTAIASQDMPLQLTMIKFSHLIASQEPPSNMLQPARSHHCKTHPILELLPSVLPPEEARPRLGL